jgi:small-conductance mechanosensitive channel
MAHILADTFLERHDRLLTAIASVVVAAVLAWLFDRAVRRAYGASMVSNRLDAAADTRLRFLRRIVEAAILVIGLAVALSQFTPLDRLAASILASGAIAAAVVGFAARQTLANAIAGVMLAVTQPLRIGDTVTFEGETGVVEDVQLTYTYLRDGRGALVVVPNERLAAGVLRNETTGSTTVAPEASVWLLPGADAERAIAAVEGAVPDARVTVAETTAEGIRLLVTGLPGPPLERLVREAEIRRAALASIVSPQSP